MSFVIALIVCYIAWIAVRMIASMGCRPVTEGDYAKGVHEEGVFPKDLPLKGELVFADNEGADILDVTSMQARSLFRTSGDWRVWGLSGPNAQGKLLLSENNMMAERHRLHCVDVHTGRDKLLFEHPGDALWKDAISEHMAIASNANLGVYGVGVDHEQIMDPQAYMKVCDLYAIDLSSGASRKLVSHTLESRIALSSDGKWLYCVKSLGQESAEALMAWRKPSNRLSGTGVPVVVRVEVATGSVEPLYPGWDVYLSPDDKSLVVTDYEGRAAMLDRAAHRFTYIDLPPQIDAIWCVANSGILVGYAKQLRKEDVQFTRGNGLPGPRPLPRVVAIDPRTKKVATLQMAHDFRKPISFGF